MMSEDLEYDYSGFEFSCEDDHIDDILLVTAFLVNMYPDLIKQD